MPLLLLSEASGPCSAPPPPTFLSIPEAAEAPLPTLPPTFYFRFFFPIFKSESIARKGTGNHSTSKQPLPS